MQGTTMENNDKHETWTSGGDDPSYILTEADDALTLRIGGAAYRNLKRIADALNRVDIRRGQEADADNTPASVFWYFELGCIDFETAEKAREAAFVICDGVEGTPDFVKDLTKEIEAVVFEG